MHTSGGKGGWLTSEQKRMLVDFNFLRSPGRSGLGCIEFKKKMVQTEHEIDPLGWKNMPIRTYHTVWEMVFKKNIILVAYSVRV